jgi:SagB-type dehydrogenase family enzyme
VTSHTAQPAIRTERRDDTALLRRAHALRVEFDTATTRVVNFLTGRSAVVSVPALAYLRGLARPTSVRDAVARLPGPEIRARAFLDRLVESTAVQVVGSPAEIEDRSWASGWRFGTAAAEFHFAARSAFAVDAVQRAAAAGGAAAGSAAGGIGTVPAPSPLAHAGHDEAIPLPAATAGSAVQRAMARRRSARRFAPRSVPDTVLAQILFSLVGVTGWSEDPVYGRLPRSLCPSGGARNPYEAYVFTNLVDGLSAGVYHYDQVAQSLLRLADGADLPVLAGGQDWAGQAAFAVVLVAYLDRVWSKYPTPGGYLNILVEAGHRAQNALLAATDHGLGARMTTAVDEDLATGLLGLTRSRHAPVYLLAFGHPG